MFSTARSCTSENLTRFRTSNLELAAVYEPLLFLYPTWFQQAARQSKRRYVRKLHTAAVVPTDRNEDHAARRQRDSPSGAEAAPYPPNSRPRQYNSQSQKPRLLNLNSIASRRTSHEEAYSRGEKGVQPSDKISPNPELSKSASRFDPASIDGLILARKLASIANSSSRTHHEPIDVSSRFLEWFVGTSEENMWFHREKSGCRIYVLSKTEGQEPGQRKLLLEGSERSRDLARQYMLKVRGEFETRSREETADTDGSQSNGRARNDPQSEYVHVNQIPIPDVWTIRTFYHYVETVLGSRAPRAIERYLYPGDDSFDKAASRLLAETFAADELKQYQSVAALRLVLAHFKQRVQVASDIGLIWTSAIENGIVPDIACFNHEIERSIMVNNVDRLEYLMWNMRLFLAKPDATTWGILLKTPLTPAQRRNLINALLRSNHLSTSQDRDIIARALIRAEFKDAVTQADGLPKFANWLHKRFGKDWLSPGAVCDMIDSCLRSTVPWKVHEVLDIARYFGISLDQLDSALLLDIIRRTKHFGDTMWFFKTIPPVQDHAIAQAQITLLFKIAWRNSLFNTCRLIWHYSASKGIISHAMQRLITSSLAMNHNRQPTKAKHYHAIASRLAAFTIGTHVVIKDFDTKFPLLAKLESPPLPLKLLCQWTPNDGSRHEQMQLAHLLLKRDLTATQRVRPMRYTSFLKQLDQAHQLDVQWIKEDSVAKANIADLLERSVKVGLRSIRKGRSHEKEALRGTTTATEHEATNTGNQSTSSMDHVQFGVERSSKKDRASDMGHDYARVSDLTAAGTTAAVLA